MEPNPLKKTENIIQPDELIPVFYPIVPLCDIRWDGSKQAVVYHWASVKGPMLHSCYQIILSLIVSPFLFWKIRGKWHKWQVVSPLLLNNAHGYAPACLLFLPPEESNYELDTSRGIRGRTVGFEHPRGWNWKEKGRGWGQWREVTKRYFECREYVSGYYRLNG